MDFSQASYMMLVYLKCLFFSIKFQAASLAASHGKQCCQQPCASVESTDFDDARFHDIPLGRCGGRQYQWLSDSAS